MIAYYQIKALPVESADSEPLYILVQAFTGEIEKLNYEIYTKFSSEEEYRREHA